MQQVAQLPAHCATTAEVRLSYANIFTPSPDLNGNPKFSVVLLMPKATTDLTALNNAIEAAVQKGTQEKWNGVRPMNLNLPIKDGDVYAAQKPDKRGMYVGHWYISCKQNPEFGKPVVLNVDRSRTENPQDVQSGDYAVAVVEFIPFSNRGSDGVTAIPKVVRKTREGERFGGGVSETDALAAVGGETEAAVAAAGYQQPTVPQGQPQFHQNPGAPVQQPPAGMPPQQPVQQPTYGVGPTPGVVGTPPASPAYPQSGVPQGVPHQQPVQQPPQPPQPGAPGVQVPPNINSLI